MIDRRKLDEATQRVASWDRVMLLSHARADGDALGALAALQRVLEAAGKKATAFVYDELPPRYQFMADTCRFTLWGKPGQAERDGQFDGIVIVDTCSWSQLEPVAEYLRGSALPKLVIDHHATRDEMAAADGDALYVIDETAASTCVMLHEWLATTDWVIDEAATEALFVGAATDTGWFRHSNTDARTLETASACLARGVRPDVLHSRLYASHSLARLRLTAELLATLQFHADGAAAVMWLTPEMFEWTAATTAETEDLVNEPLAAEPVIVSVLLVDTGEGVIRISLRSKSPEVCGRDVDVAAIAGTFGGGGHRRAAGARVEGELGSVRDQVVTAVTDALRASK